MKRFLTPMKVGILFIASLSAFFVYVWETADSPLKGASGYTVYADFSDATGLIKGGMVKVAGIDIGEITAITLVENKARVTMLIRKDVELHKDAMARKRQESLLGMTSIELTPGTPGTGLILDGGFINNVEGRDQMKVVMDNMGQITADIKTITAGLKQVLGTDKGVGSMSRLLDNMANTSDQVRALLLANEDRLQKTLENFESLSSNLRSMTEANRTGIHMLLSDARDIARELKDMLREGKPKVKEDLQKVEQGIKSLESSIKKAEETMDNLKGASEKAKSVITKLDNGQGTIGRLLTDEDMADNVADLTESASDFMNRIVKLRTIFDVRYEYHTNMLNIDKRPGGKAYVGLKLQPRFDKYYLIELIDDHRPAYQRTITTTTGTRADGTKYSESKDELVRKPDQLKFSIEFARRFYFVTLRFGLIENTGGVGTDLDFLNDSLKLKLDLFDWNPLAGGYPRLKLMASYELLNHIFLSGGMDDMLNWDNRTTWFIGAGILFEDRDLKALLTTVPLPGL
ncbi:MAG: MCE family protein [Deltaproteobacteria bacterium]|nr:MCE family protein [Deltaproteobacteria bacterium]